MSAESGKQFSEAEIDALRKNFRGEAQLFGEFLALIRRVGRSVPFGEDILAAYFCARDPSTNPRVKGILLAAIAYFVLPIDIIPDVLPFLGFTDDAAVIAAAIAAVRPWITDLHREKARSALKD